MTKEFQGKDFHSRLCEFCYQTTDWYDLNDQFGDYAETDNPNFNIHCAIWDMSDKDLLESIKYALEENPDLSYLYDFDGKKDAKYDAKNLLKEGAKK